jgi:hypothetical protein
MNDQKFGVKGLAVGRHGGHWKFLGILGIMMERLKEVVTHATSAYCNGNWVLYF